VLAVEDESGPERRVGGGALTCLAKDASSQAANGSLRGAGGSD
jgi:hypothetical protein